MTNPIDIEVKDGVDGSVEKKLAAIAKQARAGHKALEDLKTALKGLNTSPLADLQKASATHTNALARELNAQARMVEATNKGAVAAARAALEKQRLATESQRTAAAESNAARAMSQSENAALRLAQAQSRTAASKSEATREAERLAASMGRLKQSVDPLGAALDRHNLELAEATRLYQSGGMNAATFASYETTLKGRIDATTQAIAAQNAALNKGIQSGKAMTQAGLNLSRQFADIGVTAAMGMNPLMILIQQGPQIADAFATAKTQGLGFSALMRGMGAAIAPFLPIILAVGAALGTAATVFGLFHRELAKGYPKDITVGMNLTEEQLERVTSKTVTFGDTFAATFTVIGRRIMDSPIGDALEWIGEKFNEVVDWIVKTWVDGWAFQIGVAIGAYRTIIDQWKMFPSAFGDMIISGVNVAIRAIQDLLNKAADGLNLFVAGFNSNPLVMIPIPEIGDINLGQLENQYAGAGASLGEAFSANVVSGIATAREEMSRFAQDIGSEALRRARARATKEAGKANRGRGGQSDEEKRAEALRDINDALDDELALMGMVGDALAIEARMQGIINSLVQKGIQLTDTEAQTILDKVTAIQTLSHVQSQLESIYEDAVSVERDYRAGLTAANQLLAEGRINTDQHATAIGRLEYQYRQASDPMAAFNDGLKDEGELLGKFGIQLAATIRLQSVRNTLIAQGRKLTDEQTEALTRQLEQRERELMIASELDSLYASGQGAMDQLTAKTYALQIAQQQGFVSAEQYRVGLNNIAMEAAAVSIQMTGMATTGQFALASLQQYMSSYQGVLVGLTESFGQFFTTVADGFANGIARAIVYAEDFGEAMKDVARQAIAELIAGLIKMGIQWLITQAIGQTAGAAATAGSVAQAGVVAAAWAPAAAAVSLATSGANSVPASMGLISTYALSSALSMVPGLKDGGGVSGPGGPRSDKVLRWLSDGEFVVNAPATRDNRDVLEAINSGGTMMPPKMADGGVVTNQTVYRPAKAPSASAQGEGVTMKVSIENYSTASVVAQQVGPHEVRIIAREVAEEVVGAKTPAIIGAEMSDPNSRGRKSLSRHTNLQPVR